MRKIPTVKIQDGDDYRIINQSDFDPEKHKPFGVKDPEKPKPKRKRKPKRKASRAGG